jgi:hypothetical protein
VVTSYRSPNSPISVLSAFQNVIEKIDVENTEYYLLGDLIVIYYQRGRCIFSIVYRMVDSYGTFVAQFIRYNCELLRNIQFIADNCTCLYEMRCECLCPSNF